MQTMENLLNETVFQVLLRNNRFNNAVESELMGMSSNGKFFFQSDCEEGNLVVFTEQHRIII